MIEDRQVDAMASSSPGDDEKTVDPSSKCQKLTVMRVGDETLPHMDLEPQELCEKVASNDFSDIWSDEMWNSENEYDEVDCSGTSWTSSV